MPAKKIDFDAVLDKELRVILQRDKFLDKSTKLLWEWFAAMRERGFRWRQIASVLRNTAEDLTDAAQKAERDLKNHLSKTLQ